MQQNWQQQQGQQFPSLPAPHQQNFFDNIPSSTQSHHHLAAAPQTVRNNNLDPISVDGWGSDWDDWNQADNKPNGNPASNDPNISESFIQSESKPISNDLELTQRNVNWPWQPNQLTSQQRTNIQEVALTPPPSFLPTAVPPPQFQSIVNSTFSTPETSVMSKENNSASSLFGRSSQENSSGHMFPTTLTNPASILVPTPIPIMVNTNENREVGVQENIEVFGNIEQTQITLPNTQVIDTSYITPAPQIFQNFQEHDSAFKVEQNQHVKKLHQRATSAIQPTSHEVATSTNVATAQFTPQPASNVSDTLEDRTRFLNQEDLANERDRFLNGSGRQENLLPPPIAYQQQHQHPTANDDRNQYLQTSHLSEDDFVVLNNPSNDDDVSLPPPGLSRFVLGEPEHTADSERHADGEDDDAIQPPPTSISSETSRNVYSFPTSSIELQVQRVVTGVESMTVSQLPVVAISQQAESREIDLDGENLEDQQIAKPAREEPSIGGDPSSNEPELHVQTSSSIPNVKNMSNSSTGNESDHHTNNNKKYSSRSGKTRKHFESDDSEGSSERERLLSKEKDKKRRNPVQDSDDGEFSRQKNLKKREEKSGHSNR